MLINGGVIAVELLATPAQEAAAGIFLSGLLIARVPLFLFQAVLAGLLPKLSHLAGLDLFDEFASDALLAAMRAALELYRDPAAWERLVRAGMARDFSWQRQGQRYVDLYRRLVPGAAAT